MAGKAAPRAARTPEPAKPESWALTGPWQMVTYLKGFGPQAYFVNLPSKFIGQDGRTMWLCYSANWSRRQEQGNPAGSDYALCLQEITLQSNR